MERSILQTKLSAVNTHLSLHHKWSYSLRRKPRKHRSTQVDKPLQSPGDSSIKETREEGGGLVANSFTPLELLILK